jgi:hypothetical protein
MRRFRVPVVTDAAPEETRRALTRADMPTQGPIPAGRPGSPPSVAAVANRVLAYLDAETKEAAGAGVREVVGEHCAVGPAEPVGEQHWVNAPVVNSIPPLLASRRVALREKSE